MVAKCRSTRRAFLQFVLPSAASALLTAVPANADAIKPAVRGLISMGAYRFVGDGGKPVNTLAPIRQASGIFGGLVVVASWDQLQPTANGPLVANNVIDATLVEIREYNKNHPNKPLAVKLRIWAGFMSPDWAKSIGGMPIKVTHNGRDRTVGRFWSPAYRKAFANLQALLATRYDDEPLIREVAITQCMSFTAEPFFVPTEKKEDVIGILKKAGFNDDDYKNCLTNAVADYAPWKKTRLVLSLNPYRTMPGGSGDADFTLRVMRACRESVGKRCVLDNHDLNSKPGKPILPIYAEMKKLGPEIEFQTLNKTPPNFPATIKLGLTYGATGIELYQDYGGFPKVPKPTLEKWASWFDVDSSTKRP